MNGIIYMRTSPSGKRYIGQTIKDEATRWKQHVEDAYGSEKRPRNTPLSRSIRKYGPDAFTVEILESGIRTPEELNQREQYWIKEYHTLIYEKQNGLNATVGGDGNKIYTNINFQKMFDDGYSITEISQITGAHPSTVASYVTNSKSEKCSSCRRKALEKNPPRSVSNYNVDTCEKVKSFSSMAEACLFYKGTSQTGYISGALYGKGAALTAFGYLWKFDDEPMSVIYERHEKYFNSAAIRNRGLSVTNIETGEVFSKIADAAAIYNIKRQQIADCCRGKRENAGGYHWCFTGQEAVPYVEKLRRPVLCVETGVQYPSVSEASRQSGVEINKMTDCLKGRREEADGYRWKYLDNEDMPLAKKKYAHCKPVLCVETNTIYESVTEAAEKVGVNITTMANWLKGRIDSIHGYHWKYCTESGDAA